MRRVVVAVAILVLLAAGLALTRPGRSVLASVGLIAACSGDSCD
jgi:hypothetical protein